jgi:hypothetical protein
MSARDNDNIFARWSRRKQAARHSGTEEPEKDRLTSDSAAAPQDSDPVEDQLATAEPQPAEPAEPLPRVEDLTAQSDLSAFMRKGVPKMLKSAALRKMWSLDPAIRDHIGPSEYAWDFNKPGSMPGFGPLDVKQTVVDFLSTVGRGTQTDVTEAPAAPNAPNAPEAQPPQQLPAASIERESDVSPDNPADIPSPDESSEPAQSTASPRFASSAQVETAIESGQASRPAESSGATARRRHGGALPR